MLDEDISLIACLLTQRKTLVTGLADAKRGTHLNGALKDMLGPKRKN